MSSPNLLKDPIQLLLWKIGLPAGVGFFFNTLYNITDAYWAGKLGVESATAMSQTFPIFLLLIVFGNGLSNAASTLIGNALGAKNDKQVATFIQHTIFLSILVVIVVTPLLLISAPTLLHLTGDPTPAVQGLSLNYIIPVLTFAFLFLFSYTINGVLNAYGDTKTYSRALIIGALINVGLDPLFMYGFGRFPGMGIAGVAWATIVIECITLLYLIIVIYRRGILSLCHWRGWRPRRAVIREMLYIGIPSSLSMILVAIGIFIINAYLKDFGTTVMAIYGVGTRIEQIVLLPTIGLSIASSAIIAQNNGAKNFARVRKTYIFALLSGSLVILPLVVGIWFLSDFLYPLFVTGTNPLEVAEILHLGRQYTTVIMGLFWGYIFLFISTGALQAVKRPMFGLWIGVFRQVLVPLIVFSLVIRFGGDYLAIWWGIFGINWAAALIAVGYTWKTLKRIQ